MLQPISKPIKPLESVIKHYKNTDFFTTTADVFMHVFINDREEIELHKYLPYIEKISNEYKNFKYHFIIVSNDTVDSSNLSDELNNDLAFNKLWSKKESFNNIMPMNSNIEVEHIELSRYLNNSPLQKHWKSLPKQFIPFLVRAISIWEKGGIAVNPVVFTPQSPNSIYIDKVKKILQGFKKSNVESEKTMKNLEKANIEKGVKKKSKANNIREIIDELERNENVTTYSNQDILEVAESKIDMNVAKNHARVNQDDSHGKGIEHKVYHKRMIVKNENYSQPTEDSSKLLPLFLNYLFHNISDRSNSSTETNTTPRIRKSPVAKEMAKEEKLQKDFEDIKPMIVSAQGLIDNNDSMNEIVLSVKDSSEDLFELTMDLKGNVIATETPCHAFVGDIFTNAIHHDGTETLTDFIIKELSIFCKGLLASCVGIDVILI